MQKDTKTVEHEAKVRIAGGAEIPQSQLSAFNERMKQAEAARREKEREAAEEAARRGACPFRSSIDTTCRTDCAMYNGGYCHLAAPKVDGTVEPAGVCPFKNWVKCSKVCALWTGAACSLTQIICAPNNKRKDNLT